MKVLHVIAQKPQDTGSGVYLRNLIKQLNNCEQALVAGVDIEDEIHIEIPFYPVVFRKEELFFPVVGMSDRMPYESTAYKDLRDEKLILWKDAFRGKLEEVKKDFQPDIIISHHLYLLTSMVREIFPTTKVMGVCHATDLRQLMSHGLEREYIVNQISKLDKILALHENQKRTIEDTFSIDNGRTEVMGLGYDRKLFNFHEEKRERLEIWYVGKVAHAKGVEELLDAYEKLDIKRNDVVLKIAGGISGEEGSYLEKKARSLSKDVEVLGRTEQKKLAAQMKKGHILVLPSYYEGFPMVVVEALACGMKVVVNDLPGLQEGLGKGISRSGNIHFLPMPPLEEVDRICPHHRESYVENLSYKLKEVAADEKKIVPVELDKLSWEGVGRRYFEIMKEL